MSFYEVYVEKKEDFAVEAKNLNTEIKNFLQIKNLNKTRIINKYMVKNIDEQTFNHALKIIFCDPLLDDIFFSLPKEENIFAVSFLQGQYNEREEFCKQSLELLSPKETPYVKTMKIYIFEGKITKEELEKIKSYIINPIECMEVPLKEDEKNSISSNFEEIQDVKILENFNNFSQEELKNFLYENDIAMNLKDILLCQQYFKNEEKRPPTITEIKVLDTYWSDHCRHTTFNTELEEIIIHDENMLDFFNEYKKIKQELNCKNNITLMDIATIGAKKLEKDGYLKNLDKTDEINACSVVIPILIENKKEDVLLMFKNETHNHPTEIEPFGGASTCLGGAIRDPLSGRCYVYQAMRITGASNPKTPVEKTLKGKLPQIKIVKTAALGYSSYGNRIGIATGFVEEIYHEKYLAKRMEVGAVIGAVLKKNVIRKTPSPCDVVILVGGKTGRDGCGGAAGSSKIHNKFSLEKSSAEVQKGNPVEERKIQRFFLDSQITKIIKRCNDFGAGGASVAIGELSDGVTINLNNIPKKYDGLDGTELAISESQERMAVVVSKKDADFFIKKANLENLLATQVATITKEKRLTMLWNNKKIVDISRNFLDLNGAKRKTKVIVLNQKISNIFTYENTKQNWIKHMSKLNFSSQKGLVKMFDSTIGSNSVLMPYGGKFQDTKAQSMVSLIPVKGNDKTVSIMSYGANPYLEDQSPFYGSIYAVLESVSKTIATGGSLKKCWLSFQEYFPATKDDPKRFGLPFSALLGALKAQLNLKVAAIGGKDSMSGSFENLDVPPSLIAFSVSVTEIENVISPEFKNHKSNVALLEPKYEQNGEPDYASLLEIFSKLENLIKTKKVISAFAVSFGGISQAICSMCFGNKIGFQFTKKLEKIKLFNPTYGAFIVELSNKLENTEDLNIIGKTIKEYKIIENNFTIDLDELEMEHKKTLEPIFPTKVKEQENQKLENVNYQKNSNYDYKSMSSSVIKTFSPKVLIPVFPGTNCEFDMKNQFEKHGAICDVFVINNLNKENLKQSIASFAKKIKQSNIIAIPGGFSASDEPDGSAKFIAAFFRNPQIKEQLHNFLNNQDGLMLGICNGFQALMKLGLIEHGQITDPNKITATLTHNLIGTHQSLMVNTKIVSNKSPWLQYEKIGAIHTIPISHGEGRLIANEKTLNSFIQNNQIATIYVDHNQNATMKNSYNPNGSFLAIEGLISKNGKIFGKMGHSERVKKNLYKNIPNISEQLIFKSGVDYFK